MESNATGVVTIPKQLKEITELYRSCRFEEADQLLEGFDKLPHQKLAIQAQLAFFRWEFDDAVERILGYYAYLGEWYSLNANEDTILMLLFSMINCSSHVRENAIHKLTEMYSAHSDEEWHIKRIPEIIEMVNKKMEGNSLEEYACHRYQAPEAPKTLSEIIEIYKDNNKKEYAKIKGDVLANERAVVRILFLAGYMGDPSDYVSLYEKVRRSRYLLMYEVMRVAQAYRFLGRYDEARQAILDLVRYQWLGIEWTEVMPVSALIGIDCFDLYSKDLFAEIYNTPKGVSAAALSSCEKLRAEKNFDELFAQDAISGYALRQIIISKLSVISGKLIVSDPLVWLDEESKPFAQKVPKGEYDVVAQIAVKEEQPPMITAVMVRFSDAPAVTYRNAVYGDESQYEIDNSDDAYIGFPVDGGLCAIVDAKVNKAYIKFRDQFEKQHDEDLYTGYLAALFARSAEGSPETQRDCGDYIDLVIPGTEHHIPMFASGAGDGYYPVYFGYDKKNKPCSLVVEFVEMD